MANILDRCGWYVVLGNVNLAKPDDSLAPTEIECLVYLASSSQKLLQVIFLVCIMEKMILI